MGDDRGADRSRHRVHVHRCSATGSALTLGTVEAQPIRTTLTRPQRMKSVGSPCSVDFSPIAHRANARSLSPLARTGSISGSETGSAGGFGMAAALDRAVEASEIVDAWKPFGVTQLDVAAVTQVSDRAVRGWRTGDIRPDRYDRL